MMNTSSIGIVPAAPGTTPSGDGTDAPVEVTDLFSAFMAVLNQALDSDQPQTQQDGSGEQPEVHKHVSIDIEFNPGSPRPVLVGRASTEVVLPEQAITQPQVQTSAQVATPALDTPESRFANAALVVKADAVAKPEVSNHGQAAVHANDNSAIKTSSGLLELSHSVSGADDLADRAANATQVERQVELRPAVLVSQSHVSRETPNAEPVPTASHETAVIETAPEVNPEQPDQTDEQSQTAPKNQGQAVKEVVQTIRETANGLEISEAVRVVNQSGSVSKTDNVSHVVANNRTQAPINQIVSVITPLHKADQGVHHVSLRLAPEELGNVHIRVDLNDDHINVRIHADSLDTGTLLKDNLRDLKSQLESLGLQTGSLDVESGDERHGTRQHLTNQSSSDVDYSDSEEAARAELQQLSQQTDEDAMLDVRV